MGFVIKKDWAGCRCLRPIILATQEAEIRMIVVRSQLGQIVRDTYLENTYHKKGWCSDSRCRP
jgi:hypothetical protein